MSDPVFAVGDVVAWNSSSNGTTRQRQGVVCAIVPAGVHPREIGYPELNLTAVFPRKYQSYLVAVTLPRTTQYFWPLAGKLRKGHR